MYFFCVNKDRIFLAIVCVELVSLLVFYRVGAERKDLVAEDGSTESEKSRQIEEIIVKEKTMEKSDGVAISEV